METKNEPIPKEIVAATAAEPENTEPVDWTQHIARVEVESICCVQQCMLCDNTRNIGDAWYTSVPWICDECKEAIAYAKEIMKHRGNGIFYD